MAVYSENKEPDFSGKPCVIVASGPSLSDEDCEVIRILKDANLINVIVVNDNYRKIPQADALVAADQPWWKIHLHPQTPNNILQVCPKMPRWTTDPRGSDFGARIYHVESGAGIAKPGSPSVKRGSSSGYMAIGLAIRWGATHICLTGFDCKRGPQGENHWFGEHPKKLPVPQPVDRWAEEFDALAEPAKERGIRLAQCTRDTATKKLIRSTLAVELL